MPPRAQRGLARARARSGVYSGSSSRSSRLLAPLTPALGSSPRLPVAAPPDRASSQLQAQAPTVPPAGRDLSPALSVAHITGPCLWRGSECPQKHMIHKLGLEEEESRGAHQEKRGKGILEQHERARGYACRGDAGRCWCPERVVARPVAGAAVGVALMPRWRVRLTPGQRAPSEVEDAGSTEVSAAPALRLSGSGGCGLQEPQLPHLQNGFGGNWLFSQGCRGDEMRDTPEVLRAGRSGTLPITTSGLGVLGHMGVCPGGPSAA